MVALNTIKSELSSVRARHSDLVAVFIGGTSGIGEATLRSFVQNTSRPRVYLVGRAQSQADKIIADVKSSHADAEIRFIQSDVSLLRNVDDVCREIEAKEKQVNLLFLSAGLFTLAGRTETKEGLDQKLSLHYYSRLRFTQNLLPLLLRASSTQTTTTTSTSPSSPSSSPSPSPPISRVISVLGAGAESSLDTTDLSLKTTFSLSKCATHAITMTSLSFSRLAQQNPGITFIHSQPGGVKTNVARNLNPLVGLPLKLLTMVLFPFISTAEDSGQRHAWTSLAERFGGGGLKLVGPKGEEIPDTKAFVQAKQDGTLEKVVAHTDKVFEDICRGEAARYDGD